MPMMKLYVPAVLIVLLTSCLGYKELPVEYDYSYHGNFKRYRTFDIMRPVGINDTTMTNEIIEKSIVNRMRFLGYKQSDHRPHLIIGYKMYNDSLSFNGNTKLDSEELVKGMKYD